jgi:hypothetical protein
MPNSLCQDPQRSPQAQRAGGVAERPSQAAPFNRLLHSSKFPALRGCWSCAQFAQGWLAVLACAQTVLFQFVPNFPQEVWQSIDAVLVVVIATIAVEDAAQKLTIFSRHG